jgi:hypothetical protein
MRGPWRGCPTVLRHGLEGVGSGQIVGRILVSTAACCAPCLPLLPPPCLFCIAGARVGPPSNLRGFVTVGRWGGFRPPRPLLVVFVEDAGLTPTYDRLMRLC